MTGDVEVRKLDLQDLASMREFADGVDSVDVLINNAGIMAVPYALTVDGFESQIGTNHLGHFALTNLLLPKVTDRVVTVSSFMHLLGKISLKDLNWKARPYSAWLAYGQSKLANLLFTSELQTPPRRRRLDADVAVAAHPGYSATNLQGHTGNRHRHPVLGRRQQPVRHQTPTSAPARRCTRRPQDLPGRHASSARSSRCAGRPGPSPRSPLARDADTASGTVAAVRAAHGHRISALSCSSATLGVASRRGWSRPPLSTRHRVSDLVPALAVRITHDRQHRSTDTWPRAATVNKLTATVRTKTGKGASRQARRDGQVPAVLYGHGADPQHLELNARDFAAVLRQLRHQRRADPRHRGQGAAGADQGPRRSTRSAATSSTPT